MKGRPPKLTTLKLLHGEKNKERINLNQPQSSREEPTMPSHLKGLAAEEWGFVTGELRTMGVLSKTDARWIEQYCFEYATLRKLEEQIAVVGAVIVSKGDDGKLEIKSNPMLRAQKECLAACERFWSQFGFNPVARERIHVQHNKPKGVSSRQRA